MGPGLLAVLALALGSAGCAGRSPDVVQATEVARAGAPATVLPAGVHHVVQPGQTLWRIAQAYEVSVEELARVNGITDPARLEIQRSLWIPRATRVLAVGTAAAEAPVDAGLRWPVSDGWILSYFGAARRTHRHTGLDIGGHHGQPVTAAAPGVVVYSGATMRGYGKTVIVDHGDGLTSLYAHNSKLLVRKGQRVDRGQGVARMGRTGNASANHCHFEVRRGDRPVDPMLYLTEATRRRR